MDSSPKGREIKTVEGDPSAIISRGNWIETLGGMMDDCAQELQLIAMHDLASGAMDGKAVEKLQDKIGDSWETLREAAQLYQPVGPVIATYGEELQQWQPLIRSQVDTCEDLWAKYDGLPGAPTHILPGTEPEAGSPEAEQEQEAAQAKVQAREDWENAAETWDSYYDSWEDAYDVAVNGIGNEMAGTIEDGFWEVLDDIISVLEYIALGLFIIALFVAGPFAAIAFVISAAILLARAAQFCAGECTWQELALAALDVIPFGKFGKMASSIGELGTQASKWNKFTKGLSVAGGFDDMAVARKPFSDIMTGLHTGLDVRDIERVSSGNMWAAAGEMQGAVIKQVGALYGHVNTAVGGVQAVTA
ncbi:hypothetical protein [Nocardioides albus]|uniref:Uncharacterized protein n=1 Tax=Nocardioides albus TaxID=1841 RepID=A0A7W5A2A0_9ACTN|nr:hypothetical protein [Nocardioides albus]MBB3088174.1 hypothetical protein [Nocardioides albus]GGU22995.1 hypothetical protein GCM10007979_22410 [Nocardioides albus]